MPGVRTTDPAALAARSTPSSDIRDSTCNQQARHMSNIQRMIAKNSSSTVPASYGFGRARNQVRSRTEDFSDPIGDRFACQRNIIDAAVLRAAVRQCVH